MAYWLKLANQLWDRVAACGFNSTNNDKATALSNLMNNLPHNRIQFQELLTQFPDSLLELYRYVTLKKLVERILTDQYVIIATLIYNKISIAN